MGKTFAQAVGNGVHNNRLGFGVEKFEPQDFGLEYITVLIHPPLGKSFDLVEGAGLESTVVLEEDDFIKIQDENSCMLGKIIKCIHAENVGICDRNRLSSGHGVWNRIVSFIMTLNEKGIIQLSPLMKRVGNGNNTLFWHDIWVGNSALWFRFYILDNLETEKRCFVMDRRNSYGWKWCWRRNTRGGIELAQFNELVRILEYGFCQHLRIR
ncbi:hypothetical protein L1987_69686 [Smallanthus sonchifolius]|uniref:Uncharacterized protein n=1 Tax=Smallanthus sonchifolius TaxID=185202 RepID=A0ACB9B5N2_9ASTR|nr:hypothetical protein L1987_69686 [Smallanthus sonchifolius]